MRRSYEPTPWFDAAASELIAKALARDVGRLLDILRETAPRVPREFDFGVVSKVSGAGALFKLRITGGGVTVREECELPSSVVCHQDEEVFNNALDVMLSQVAVKFAAHFAV